VAVVDGGGVAVGRANETWVAHCRDRRCSRTLAAGGKVLRIQGVLKCKRGVGENAGRLGVRTQKAVATLRTGATNSENR